VASDPILLTGTLPKLKTEEAERVSIYLASGEDVLGEYPIEAAGHVRVAVDRAEVAALENLALVVGPSGMGEALAGAPELQRVPIDSAHLTKAKTELRLPLEKVKLNKAILERWWGWCEWYCVSGQVIGPDGCPVPFAEVTVNTVSFLPAKTPRVTVLTDQNGNFTACFNWCQWPVWCWPCWPFWWWCWPWWWEWDILHVIDRIEEALPRVPVGPGPVENARLALGRPESVALARGEAFATARRAEERFEADPTRTNLISRKLANPAIRRLFPWWWWCCDDPNICFTVRQNGNVVLDENPETDTRWCFEENQSVTLVAGGPVVTTCPPTQPPLQGFLWTRVGNTVVSTIHQGYADGNTGAAASDLAFWDGLDIYGEFAPGTVAYYQLVAGQWTGDPARGGTMPTSSASITPDLYNTVLIWHQATNTVTFHQVKMGPFSHNGLTGLYATQDARVAAPVPWPAFPPHVAGDVIVWAYNGLKVSTDASSLIGGAGVGGVTLSVNGYNAAFASVALTPNPDDHLTLEIDNHGTVTTAHINAVHVYDNNNVEVTSTGTQNCPAYEIHPGGYVVLDVTVQDTDEHLESYRISPEFGHASFGSTTPGERDYQPPATFPPSPYKAPNTALKSFGGGTEDIYFHPMLSCCYDFRLYVSKRVTNGSGSPGEYTGDFWTVMIKVI
jgi:hypothetical protein